MATDGYTRHQLKIMPVIFLAAFICACAASAAGPANDSTSDSSAYSLRIQLKNDLCLTGKNACAAIAAPLHWNGRSWACAGLGLGAAGCAFATDPDVRRFAQSHRSSGTDPFILPWRHYGEWYTGVTVGSGLYLSGLCLPNPWLRETGRAALTAVALTSIVNTTIKISCGRSRPFLDRGPYMFSAFETSTDQWSFPSGHTATAFALSSVCASRIGNIWAALGLYGAAALTAAERIYEDRHWLSDTMLGALIGTAVGRFVAGSGGPQPRSGAGCWTIEPVVTATSAGVLITAAY